MQKHGDQYLIAMFSPFGGNQGENNSQKAKLVLPNHVLHSPNLLAVFKKSSFIAAYKNELYGEETICPLPKRVVF